MRSRGNLIVLGAPIGVAVWFIYSYAFMYLTLRPQVYGIYWQRHEWLYAHIVAGILALLSGPVQLWLGLNRRTGTAHQVAVAVYATASAVGGMTAFYLAAHTDFGWVFGLGFITMASVGMITVAFAIVAMLLGKHEQYGEWMIRSYVLTFSFVTFHLADALLDIANTGSIMEQKTAASWLCWTIPLVLTECILQGRKIFTKSINAAPLRAGNVYTAAPNPAAFSLQNSESFYQRRP